jgi:hypothetical protein
MRITIAVLVLLVLAVGGWFVFGGGLAYFEFDTIQPRLVGASVIAATDYVVPELEDNYQSAAYGFSLRMPEGFTAAELPEDESGGTAIVMQDSKGNGIQIYVTPFAGSGCTLTADMIMRDIPDMEISRTQDVEVGDDCRGVAFLSNNDAFSGASRDVWFAFRGHLYQISTYQRLDNLLQAMFATWKFF